MLRFPAVATLLLLTILTPAATAEVNIVVGGSQYDEKDKILTVTLKVTADQNATYQADLHPRPGFTIDEPTKTMELLEGDIHTFIFQVEPAGQDEVQGTYVFHYDISANGIVIESGDLNAKLGEGGRGSLGLPAPAAPLLALLLLGVALVVRGRAN